MLNIPKPLKRLIRFFTSLRLTVACLALAMVLVFAGTLAQVDEGLYAAQHRFFRSFFIYWSPGGNWKIPVFPGGYLLGTVLLVNLIAAHIQRFSLTRKKAGIFMVHAGLILLLLGQLLTDLLSVESVLHLREGESKNYSVTERASELAVIDVTDPAKDKVVAIPQKLLRNQAELRHPELPFTVRVKQFFPNSDLANLPADSAAPGPASEGAGKHLRVTGLPRTTSTEQRDIPSAIIELAGSEGSLGTWLVSERLAQPQPMSYHNRSYELTLRQTRHYKPFTIKLLDFTHASYKGTDIPKDYASRIRLDWPEKGEAREVRIYMNNPLRYWGETYYQASFDLDDHGSVLQVVHNPAWLTPYLSCGLVGGGLAAQFLTHLLGFIKRRAK